MLRIIIDCVPAAEAPLATIEEQIKQEGRLQGRQEGRQEGRVEALRDVLRMLIEQRFGPVSPAHEALIAVAVADDLERGIARVAVAPDLASLFQRR